jgi:DNA-binding transcriptional regulator LsrR (DeoR family)
LHGCASKKVKGLAAALRGKLITELIIDEPTARNLVEGYILSRNVE